MNRTKIEFLGLPYPTLPTTCKTNKTNNKQDRKAYFRNYYNCEKWRNYNLKKQKEYRQRLKIEVLQHYAPNLRCRNCGFEDIRALSIDHINGGGSRHLQQIDKRGNGRTEVLYRWLKKNRFPDGFQVLCMNCQWIKRAERGEVRQRGK